MAHFILIRHGQTEWNKEVRFRGHVDIALDETGRRQADAAAGRIANLEVTAVYSSPLSRAMATAQPIAERLGLAVKPVEGFIDMHFGDWQGLSIAEVEDKYPDLFELWRRSPERLQIPEGESLDDVRRRAVAAVEELAAQHGDDRIVIVTHRVVCRVLICHLLGLDNSHFWQIGQDTTAINIFDIIEGKAIVSLLNDTCHLVEH